MGHYRHEPVVEALCDFAKPHKYSESQVLEMATASFLYVDAVLLSEISKVPNVGQFQEENVILKLQLKATHAVLAKASIPGPSIYPKFLGEAI